MSIISEFGDKRTDVLLLAQDDQEPAVLWGRTPESQAGDPKGIVTELSTEPGQKGSPVTSETRSRSSSVNSWDSAVGLGATVDHTASEVSADSPHSSARFSTISVEEFAQELVVKSIKVKKKKKRRQGGHFTCHLFCYWMLLSFVKKPACRRNHVHNAYQKALLI